MAGRRKQSPAEHQSWKRANQAGAGARRSVGSRTGQRWLMTLFSAGVIVTVIVLAVLAWLNGAMRTHFFTLVAGDYHKLSVPPIPWHGVDLNTSARPTTKYVAFVDASQFFTAIGTSPVELVGGRVKKSDCVIFYAAAHAIPNQDHTGVDLLLPGDQRRPISSLIEQLGRFPAATKLLVLDCGRLATDLRYGILANDFPELLQQELTRRDGTPTTDAATAGKSSAAGDVWVLASHGSCQVDTGWFGRPRTLFGDSIIDGLAGSANSANGDNVVDLAELYSYVAARCELESGGVQVPMLLHCGDNRATMPVPATPLVRLSAVPKIVAANPAVTVPAAAADGTAPAAAPSGTAPTTPEGTGAQQSSTEGPLARRDPIPTAGPQPLPAAEAAGPSASGQPAEASAAAATPAPATAAPARAAAPATATAAPPDPGTSPQGATSPPAGPTPPAAAPPVSPPVSDPPSRPAGDDKNKSQSAMGEYVALLDRGWELRDAIQGAAVLEEAGGTFREWSPVEFMPHLWRELNVLLLDYELRVRASASAAPSLEQPPKDNLQQPELSELRQLVDGLEELQRALAGDTDLFPRTPLIVDRMTQWCQYSLGQAEDRQTFAPASMELAIVADGVRQARRIQFQLAYFVRWHGDAMWVASQPDAARFDPLTLDLDQSLTALTQYQTWFQEHERSAVQKSELVIWEERQREVAETYQQLHDTWNKGLAALMDKPGTPRDYVMGELMLASPLLSSEQRQQLRTWVMSRSRSVPETVSLQSEVTNDLSLSVSTRVADRLRQHTRWNIALARLASRPVALRSPDWFGAKSDLGANAPTWAVVQTTGADLQRLASDIESDIERGKGSSPNETLAWLQLLDGRTPLGLKPSVHPVLTVRPVPLEPQLSWRERVASSLRLESTSQPLQFIVHTTGDRTQPLSVVLEYDDAKLRVADGSEKTWLPGSTGHRFDFDDNGMAQVQVVVTSRMTRDEALRAGAELQITVASGDLPELHETVTCVVPAPEELILLAQQSVRGQWIDCPQTSEGVLELPMFPNRDNTYRLALKNLTGAATRVSVKLVKIDDGAAGQGDFRRIPPGRLVDQQGRLYQVLRDSVLDANNELRPNLEIIAESNGAVALGRGEQQWIDFSAPAPTPPAAGTGTPPPATPPPAATAVVGKPSEFGLVCVITEEGEAGSSGSKRQWEQWIGWTTISPAEYTAFNVEYRDGNVVGNLELLNRDQVPDLAKGPVELRWDDSKPMKGVTPKNLSAKLVGVGQSARLIGTVFDVDAGRGQMAEWWVHVDGAPRVFKMEVPLSDGQQGRPSSDAMLLDMVRVELTGAKRAYYLRKGTPPKPTEEGFQIIEWPDRAKPMIFERPEEDKVLSVQFAVDAPREHFKPHNDDLLTLSLQSVGREGQNEVKAYHFFRDRQQSVVVKGAEAGGVINVSNKFSDYQVDIPLTAGFAGRYQLVLALQLVGERSPDPQKFPLFFDGDLPKIDDIRIVPARPRHEDSFKIQFSASDLSGTIVSAEYGWVKKVDDPLAEPLPAQRKSRSAKADRFEGELVAENKSKTPVPRLLKIVVKDYLGHQGEATRWVDIDPAPVPVEPVVEDFSKYKGMITGVVMGGTQPMPRFDVEIKGPNHTDQTKTDDQGKFTFKEVPVGTFEITASGYYASDGVRSGSNAAVKLEKPDDYKPPVKVITVKGAKKP